MPLRRVVASRFLNSLIEGGSRPALVQAEDGARYVVKLRGAAQGVGPLAAEILVGELARRLGLNVPEIVLVDLPENFGQGEPDEELRDLLRWSAGTNVGLAFVPEAVMFDRASTDRFHPLLASKIVWLDALTLNVDRTANNPNLLQRGAVLFLIDHGAAMYFHFAWSSFAGKSRLRFEAVRTHVLLPWATELRAASVHAKSCLSWETLASVVDLVPDDLFAVTADSPAIEEQRRLYLDFLLERVAVSDVFEVEAERAHEELV